LSSISFPCIFKFWANRVNIFERMNMKLKTFELSIVGSKRKVCTLSTNFRWFWMTFTSGLLWQSFESVQPNQSWLGHLFFKNHT
jgi:hypothetical protein